MAKEPKERREPSSSRKRGSSASRSQKTRKPRDRKSPSVTWAKWIEGLGEQHGSPPGPDELAHPLPDELDTTATPVTGESERARERREALAKLRAATRAAQESRQSRAGTSREQRGEPATPVGRAGRARRPGTADAPRRPTTPAESGAATTATDARPAAEVQPAARPLIPDAAPTAAQVPPVAPETEQPAPATEPTETTVVAAEETGPTLAESATPAPTAADASAEAVAEKPAEVSAAKVSAATDEAAAAAKLPESAGLPSEPPEVERTSRHAPTVLVDPPLPDGYGTDVIRLFARDPEWLFAYWEITAPNWQRARSALGDEADQARLVLRVYAYNPDDADTAESSYDIDISGPARSWYIHAGRPSIGYEVELGLLGPGGQFVGLARSNRTTTPRDSMSPILDEEWRCLEREYQEIFTLSGGYQVGASSLELRELIGRRLQEVMGSEAVSSFGASESLVERRGRHRGFWFVLGTELIVYGATEPDAQVTCQGHPIPLRPDGTFSLRFALPDGKQVIPCTARSADGIDTITITPAVDKWTQREEHSLDDPAFTAHATPGDRESSDEPWRRK